jgi:cellobiose-specific phosphotransferase system component IIA
MKNNEVGQKEQPGKHSAETQKGIDNHKKAATHFDAASKSHIEAAKHHENGDHEKAEKHTIEAKDHSSLAHDAQKEVVKHNATKH